MSNYDEVARMLQKYSPRENDGEPMWLNEVLRSHVFTLDKDASWALSHTDNRPHDIHMPFEYTFIDAEFSTFVDGVEQRYKGVLIHEYRLIASEVAAKKYVAENHRIRQARRQRWMITHDDWVKVNGPLPEVIIDDWREVVARAQREPPHFTACAFREDMQTARGSAFVPVMWSPMSKDQLGEERDKSFTFKRSTTDRKRAGKVSLEEDQSKTMENFLATREHRWMRWTHSKEEFDKSEEELLERINRMGEPQAGMADWLPEGDPNDYSTSDVVRQKIWAAEDEIKRMVLNFHDFINCRDVQLVAQSRLEPTRKQRVAGIYPRIAHTKVVLQSRVREYLAKLRLSAHGADYSHAFFVRGHWRHLQSPCYTRKAGECIWIYPFVKGAGELLKKSYDVRGESTRGQAPEAGPEGS